MSERVSSERGTSLLELTIVCALLAAAMAAILPVLVSVQSNVAAAGTRGGTNDEAVVALAQVERDVRSGNVLGAPGAVGGIAGLAVTVATQDRGNQACVQYEVRDGALVRRSRAAGTTVAWPDVWATVARGIVNAQSATPAFTRSTDRQTLGVRLLVRQGGTGEPLDLSTSITGRNTTYYDTPFAGKDCT